MANINKKRIEESATTALKTALLCCPILESYIDSNDKTPSWDGRVFVYKDDTQRKKDLKGTVPIQVKGTTQFYPFTAKYSCDIDDIKNYYNSGGCLFFLVSVNPSVGKHKIYYSSLLVFDLKKIIDSAGQQKSYTIHLQEFPEGNISEISYIFLNYIENSKKQTSFIDKNLNLLELLKHEGHGIEFLTFSIPTIALKETNIANFLATHDFYLYAKPKGLDIEIPVEKVNNATVIRQIDGDVIVGGITYYNSYNVIYREGESYLKLGEGITISLNVNTNKVDVSFKPYGTLSNFINDAECFLAILENHEVVLNGAKLCFLNSGIIDTNSRKASIAYYKDVKLALNILGVKEELELKKLTQDDETKLRYLTNAILHEHRIALKDYNGAVAYGGITINNLIIWIWAEKQADGNYRISNFFEKHKIFAFSDDHGNSVSPIQASQFFLLKREAFLHCSNMDCTIIAEDIKQLPFIQLVKENVTELLLDILSAYDEKEDITLLNLANEIAKWLISFKEDMSYNVSLLNYYQTIKRMRKISTNEFLAIGKLLESNNPPIIRCGAYLLLDDVVEAQKCFDELTQEEKIQFLTFPICKFGTLHM